MGTHTQGRVPEGDAQQRRVGEPVAHVLLDPDQLLRQGLSVGRVAALLEVEGHLIVGSQTAGGFRTAS